LELQNIKSVEFRIRFGSIREVTIEEELKMFYDIRKSLWKHTSHDFAIIAQACKTHRFEYLNDYFGELNTLYKRHAWVREILHGFDLACNEEVGHPLRYFHSMIKRIQIPPLFHAGESGPIDKILDNIKYCIEVGCKRIGHGIYAAKDPILLEKLKRADICLELCPWSNVYLNVTKTKKELINLYEIIFASGVKYCINTDDPNKIMNDEDRKNIIRQLLNRVYGVSSQEYQERVWLKGLGPECDSYDETICNFFDTAVNVNKCLSN
jgi:adenosine deaminase